MLRIYCGSVPVSRQSTKLKHNAAMHIILDIDGIDVYLDFNLTARIYTMSYFLFFGRHN